MSTRPRTPGPNTPAPGKLPITELAELKARRQRIVMVTAYDAPSGRLADEAGVDLILVGDSAAMTVLGHDSTVPATMDDMLLLARAAARGAERPLVVADLPFGSYQVSDADAVRNAIRFERRIEHVVVALSHAPRAGRGIEVEFAHRIENGRRAAERERAPLVVADAVAGVGVGVSAGQGRERHGCVLTPVPPLQLVAIEDRLSHRRTGVGASGSCATGLNVPASSRVSCPSLVLTTQTEPRPAASSSVSPVTTTSTRAGAAGPLNMLMGVTAPA